MICYYTLSLQHGMVNTNEFNRLESNPSEQQAVAAANTQDRTGNGDVSVNSSSDSEHEYVNLTSGESSETDDTPDQTLASYLQHEERRRQSVISSNEEQDEEPSELDPELLAELEDLNLGPAAVDDETPTNSIG